MGIIFTWTWPELKGPTSHVTAWRFVLLSCVCGVKVQAGCGETSRMCGHMNPLIIKNTYRFPSPSAPLKGHRYYNASLQYKQPAPPGGTHRVCFGLDSVHVSLPPFFQKSCPAGHPLTLRWLKSRRVVKMRTLCGFELLEPLPAEAHCSKCERRCALSEAVVCQLCCLQI
jgi:hypothetical protein